MLAALASPLLLVLQAPLDPTPEDEDVVAGWGAFGLFALLILAIVVLGVSLTRRLKNVDRAEEQGLYDPSDKKARQSTQPMPTYDDPQANR